mmetsp:Transcript_5874/g.13058  ORF Transcript_5874/g.13058 Transcript_5874/m.13058 type:complete len:133 (-) Transcript_5874:1932-2330(-)
MPQFVMKHRGKGLGDWLMETILMHPDIQEYQSIYLLIADAPGLHEDFVFDRVRDPQMFIVRKLTTILAKDNQKDGTPGGEEKNHGGGAAKKWDFGTGKQRRDNGEKNGSKDNREDTEKKNIKESKAKKNRNA